MSISKRFTTGLAAVLAVGTLFSVAGCANFDKGATTGSGSGHTIAVVPKMTGITWFQRMQAGVEEYAKETGENVTYGGPATGDNSQQVAYVEDLIAKKVDAICIVPFDTKGMEDVLKKARKAGIVVIAHEASDMTNIDYDIEAFTNKNYGEHFMKILGKATGGKGSYLQFVGSLGSKSHNEFVDAAQAYQKENFPDMRVAGGRIETKDDSANAKAKTIEAIKANPDLKAIEGSASTDVVGAAQAVEELGLTGKVAITGTSNVSIAGKYIKNGTINSISFWDPALSAKAMINLANQILDGKKVQNGMDLNVDGYKKMTLTGDKVLVAQDAWIDVTKANVDNPDYNF
jgi:simple sugar transport system substrate-binding protein